MKDSKVQHLKLKKYIILAAVALAALYAIISYAERVRAEALEPTGEVVVGTPVAAGGLYDESILRTIYLEFTQQDWWQQLINNYNAGQEENLVADLILDGIRYPGVGVRLRGMTSYHMTGNSLKKSFNIEIDYTDSKQRLMGYKTLNLNNASMDPSFVREVLYFHIMRKYVPCPQANFVKLVINGENWGIYVNVQQHNADLIKEWFQNSSGDRWKVGGGAVGRAFQIGAQGPQQISFVEWSASPAARDVNGDGQITEEDFISFINSQRPTAGSWRQQQQMSFAEWSASPAARDVNGDGQITEEDYNALVNQWPQPFFVFGQPPLDPNIQAGVGGISAGGENVFVFGGGWFGGVAPQQFGGAAPQQQMSFAEWSDSPAARDVNGDGQITEEDFGIFFNPQTIPGAGQLPINLPFTPAGGAFGGSVLFDPQLTPAGGAMPIAGAMPIPAIGAAPAAGAMPIPVIGTMPQMAPAGGTMPIPAIGVAPTAGAMPPGMIPLADPNMIAAGGMFIPGSPGGGGGGIMMFGGGNGALSWLGNEVAAYEQMYELKTAKTSDPWGNLIKACDILNNTPIEQLPEVVGTVLAVDRWLWFLAIENIFTDEDSYLTKGWDYQIYYEPETGQIHPLEHDGNETFNLRDVNLSPFEGEKSASRPVISRLLAVPQFRQRYLAHIRTIIDEWLDWQILAPKIEAYRALIADEVRLDTKKLYSNAQFEASFTDLENFIKNRRHYLLNHEEIKRSAPRISSVTRPGMPEEGSAPKPGQAVRITAQVEGESGLDRVILHYATGAVGPFNSVAMFDDGAHGDGGAGDGLFGGEIPPCPAESLVRYYIEAQAADEAKTTSFLPSGAEHRLLTYRVLDSSAENTPNSLPLLPTAGSSVRLYLNEFMADNSSTIEDPDEPGSFEDWIEIYNPTDSAVDMGGMYLTDDLSKPTKWQIPQGVIIPAKGYLLFWADEDKSQGNTHTNFKLSKAGEQIGLFDTDARGNVAIDTLTFSAQSTDVSQGRLYDGGEPWGSFEKPTPGSTNSPGNMNGEGLGETQDLCSLINGDLNRDGSVSPADALSAFRCYLGLATCPDCADVDRNGSVTPADALCIFKRYLGLASCLD